MAILSGENIVCLAQERWHGPWKTYQQIMSILAETNRVLYIGPPTSLRDGIWRRLRGIKRRPVLERFAPSLYVYHEPFPLGRANPRRIFSRRFNWATGRLRLAQARSLARRLGMASPILWVFDPMMVHALGAFEEKLVIGHILDKYVELVAEPSARAAMARNEEQLLRAADIGFAVSDSLLKRCLQHNPNSFLVPNGVDYELFQAVVKKAERPPDIMRVARPIVGFVGAIQGIIDFSLLDALSAKLARGSLVLVGPEELGAADRSRLQALMRRPNVRYLGCKTVREVPAYIDACDVCVIPYHVHTGTVPDCDCIKLYEYLACGKPVVSTDIPSVRRFRPLVAIAADVADFSRYVEAGLREDPGLCETRRVIAREHSWRRRVETLSEAIYQQIALTRARRGAVASLTGS